MKNFKIIIILIGISLLLGGCSGLSLVSPGGANLGDLRVETNEKWSAGKAGNTAFWTQDGVLLNKVSVTKIVKGRHITGVALNKQNKAFKYDSADTLESVMELYIDALTANGLFNVELLDNRPSSIDGMPAIEFEYIFDSAEKLRYKNAAKFVQKNDVLFQLIASAPAEYYFPKLENDFNKILATASFE